MRYHRDHRSGLYLSAPAVISQAVPMAMQRHHLQQRGYVRKRACIVDYRPPGSLITTDLTTYTHSAQDIGAADPSRIVVVLVFGNGSPAISSATIRGVAATVVVSDTGNAPVEIIAAAVPEGTTGDIVITLASTGIRQRIAVYAVYNASGATPADWDKSTANPGVTTVAIPTGGIVIAGSAINGGTNPTTSWTNADENFDLGGEAVNEGYSGASRSFSAEQPSYSITSTYSAGSFFGQSAVAYGP